MAELISHERTARTERAGLWSLRMYSPISADRVNLLMSLRSTFQIVRGRVAEVAQTKAGTYLNFGTNWKDDFTIFIPSRIRSETSNSNLKDLKGRNIEVRGWIERRNGPMITIAAWTQIEHLDAPLAAMPDPQQPTQAGTGASQSERPGEPESSAPSPKEERPEPMAPGVLDL